MPKKILLADDSITIQKVVELTFSDGDFEVTAVNNGTRAIQKLSEMRPDIILSDIIMPEKNGYEVCEYVKSHPDFRNIPVILLTGTFEPFDPDRAEKAGCDAVVTKPFESQSLIQKVDELIANSQPAPAAASPSVEEETPSPWLDDAPAEPHDSGVLGTGTGEYATPDESFGKTAEDIFAAPVFEAPAFEAPALETPAFETPAFDAPAFEAPVEEPGFTSYVTPPTPFDADVPHEAFERESAPMSFAETPPATAGEPPAASPWDEPADFGRDSGGFTTPSFDSFARTTPPVEEASAADDSPFGEPPPAEDFSSATRSFPKMSFDDFQQPAETPASFEAPAELPPPTAPSPWDEPAEAPAFATTAFPKMSFDDLPLPPAHSETPAWDAPAEEPAFGTRAFEKVDFDEFAKTASQPLPEPEFADHAPSAPETSSASQPWDEAPEPNPWATDSDASDFASQQEHISSANSFADAGSYSTSVVPPIREHEAVEEAAEDVADEAAAAAEVPAEVTDETPAEEMPFAAEAPVDDMPFAATQEPEVSEPETESESLYTLQPEAEPAREDLLEAEPASDNVAYEPQETEWPAAEVPEDAPAAMSEQPDDLIQPPPIPEAISFMPPPPPPPPISFMAPPPPPSPQIATGSASDLSEEQVDRIARRVVEMLSDQVVRNIAWEVVPDLAEVVVKERIRQLESEA